VIELSSEEIHVRPIGYVERLSPEEDDRDRSVVSKIVVESEFAKGLARAHLLRYQDQKSFRAHCSLFGTMVF
jgi:hypothetical protein